MIKDHEGHIQSQNDQIIIGMDVDARGFYDLSLGINAYFCKLGLHE